MLSLESLNERQREAVLKTEGPVLILAGAGSGKTRVLTYRIAHLTQDLGVRPYHILAITFTNKAAGEMKERVEGLCGLDAGEMWVMTFHACCLRILKRHQREIGMDEGFIIYDPEDQKTIVRRILKELELSDKQFTPKGILNEISNAKNELISYQTFAERAHGNFYLEKVAQVYERYQKTLRTNHALDFDDLIFDTVQLFRSHPDILDYYQERFRYIMVDEYQDTNTAQYKLISILSAKYQNLCVVGDDDQSIYRFRGANIRNILDFEKDFPNAYVVRLEQNYRSTANILNAANALIRNNESRKEKTLWTDKASGDLITLYHVPSDKEEADVLITELMRLQQNGRHLYEAAFLYRANSQSRALEESLLLHNIPYRLYGGTPFYQRKEIKDILSYLRLLVNDKDYVSAERIMNVPPRGIGEVTKQKLLELAKEKDWGICFTVLMLDSLPEFSRSNKKLSDFALKVQKWREDSVSCTIAELTDRILSDIGYSAYLAKDDELKLEDRLQNIEEFKNRAAQYEEDADDATLSGFLEELSLITSIDNYDQDADVVSLMTLHSAKGLEFPIVFLPGFEEGIFPSYMSVSSQDEEDIAEERRLCYVGITRAQEKLYISRAEKRRVNGMYEPHRPSRFLKELPLNLLDEKQAGRMDAGYIGRDDSGASSRDFSEGRSYRFTDGDYPDFDYPSYRYEGASRYAEMKASKEVFASARPHTQAVSAAPEAGSAFGKGDLVVHPKFGRGIITDAVWLNADWMLTINFGEVGVKKIMAKFANLKKI